MNDFLYSWVPVSNRITRTTYLLLEQNQGIQDCIKIIIIIDNDYYLIFFTPIMFNK